MADIVQLDGSELVAWKWEHDGITRLHMSLDEDQIMRENAAIRSNGLARNLTFGRPLLRMSEAQLEALRRRFPLLRYGSAAERSKIWKRIARDPEYRNLWVR